MAKTIVAQATAIGLAGLTVIRVSGDDAFQIADKCFRGKKKISAAKSHSILYGKFIENGIIIDDVTASIFKAPNSYTGENTVEFGTHGGTVIPNKIVQTLMNAGCKHAEPGEFTRRAFINGKINLVQAEAIADIIHSISLPTAQISARQLHGGITDELAFLRNKLLTVASKIELNLDFADEEITTINTNDLRLEISNAIADCKRISSSFKAATILREGYFVAIIGKPNAGKSTLFNSLLLRERAIVSEIAGTTRDFISENLFINEIPLKLVDTAGLRETGDLLELAGIRLSQNILEQANLLLFLNDISLGAANSEDLLMEIRERYPKIKILLVQNKCDLISDSQMIFNDKIIKKTDEFSDNFDKTVAKNNAVEAVTVGESVTVSKNLTVTETIYISAKNSIDLEYLRRRIGEFALESAANSNDILLNERQYFKLLEVERALESAVGLLFAGFDVQLELLSIELRNAGILLGELTGETWNEEVLHSIFSRFCIGK